MTLYTVTIAGVSPDPEVYASLAMIDNYIGAMIGDGADAWRALVTAGAVDNRGRIAVAATRYLNRLSWQGTANAAGGTTLAWPRTGVVVGGVAVDPATVPAPIVAGFEELCALAADDPDILTAVDQGSNIKLVGAGGGVEVEYFNPTSAALGTASSLPRAVQQLLGPYLAGAGSSSSGADGGFAGNGSCISQFERGRGYDRGDPF